MARSMTVVQCDTTASRRAPVDVMDEAERLGCRAQHVRVREGSVLGAAAVVRMVRQCVWARLGERRHRPSHGDRA